MYVYMGGKPTDTLLKNRKCVYKTLSQICESDTSAITSEKSLVYIPLRIIAI